MVPLNVRLRSLLPLAGMAPCPPREDQDEADHQRGECSRSGETAQGEATVGHRLIEQVAHGGPERPG